MFACGCWGFNSQRPDGPRVPVQMVLPCCVMTAVVLVSLAVQPASHSCPNEINDCGPIWGNTCAAVAVADSGNLMFVVCDDSIVLLSGSRTDTGLVVGIFVVVYGWLG